MSIMSRLTRLFKADIHAVLDQLEEPELVIKQALREMEEELESSQQRLVILEQDQQQTLAQIEELQQWLDQINSQLDLCIEADNAELGKHLIRRKLEHETLCEQLDRSHQKQAKEMADQKSKVKEQVEKLSIMRSKASVFDQAEKQSAPHKTVLSSDPSASISDNDVEIAWLQEKQRRAS